MALHVAGGGTAYKKRKKSVLAQMKEQKVLLLMIFPIVAWIIIFAYIPLVGWTMAFQDYRPQFGFFEQTWVGFRHFIALYESPTFGIALRNTIGMGLLGLIFNFLSAITFAVLVNELRFFKFKRIIQTISYLPHFVSWVIVGNLVITMLAPDGAINNLLVWLGIFDSPLHFMAQPNMFWGIITSSDVWKSTGWGAIIYLAAMAGIDPGLYEAAEMDGANRWQRIKNITLPGIRPTIMVLLIMSVGNVINIGFERQMILGNNIVMNQAIVVEWYALNYGIGLFRFSYGTAVGMFRSFVSIVLLLMANGVARKMGEGRII